MSKLKLRALNSQNISTNAPHNDLNKQSLLISWKEFYKVKHYLNIFKNQFYLFKKANKINTTFVNLKKKYFFYTFKINKLKNVFYNFKIIKLNNNIIILSLKHNNNKNYYKTPKILKNEFFYFYV